MGSRVMLDILKSKLIPTSLLPIYLLFVLNVDFWEELIQRLTTSEDRVMQQRLRPECE